MLRQKLTDLTIGASGIGLTEVVQQSATIGAEDIGSIGNLIIQIAIGIFTLLGIFKRKSKE